MVNMITIGYIYFIQRQSDKAIKIGVTKDLRRRSGELSNKYGAIDILGVIPVPRGPFFVFNGPNSLEHILHRAFDDSATNENEWFVQTNKLMHFINNNTFGKSIAEKLQEN